MASAKPATEKPATKPRKRAAKPTEIMAFKAFDADLKCRGFQYEVGKTFTHEGPVSICDTGFHSCVEPLDVLNYYDITSSRFATVKAGGAISRNTDGDSKIASASISIVAELKLPDFIRAAIKATFVACKAAKTKGSSTSGDYATNASSGHSAKNAATGPYAVITAAGRNSQARGAKGVWIAQAEYDSDGKCIGFATGQAGYGDVPADTWLIAKGGKLVSA